jgi:DNA-binding CsgD family transcriptional regulator/tetratricopeptide (TPR) repeat protein
MRARLTSSRLVGRVGELAELELACREAAAGRPSLVLVRGESGVGKTRLINELENGLTVREVSEAMVLRGEAVEHGDTELPYTALLGALRPLVRSRDPALEALSAGSRTQLAALLPALDDGRGGTPRDDGSGQLRLFEALLELLVALSERATVVLCFEDLHWADRSTLTFVTYLARSLRDERLVLILSYRSDELHRRHPLRPVVAELERLERARRIELEPFDRAELTEALADILGSAPSGELVERLQTRSQGNPLYIEELLAAGLDGRGATPQSLRDAFLLRIERLGAHSRRAVRAIAVGRELSQARIEELTGIEPRELAVELREALAEQVLEAADDDTLRFRHELLREVVYDDLLPGERGELHLALARILERTECEGADGGVEHAATIARHYEAAGDQPSALRAAVRAAFAAQQVHAYGEAADLFERALALWPRVLGRSDTLDLIHTTDPHHRASQNQHPDGKLDHVYLLASASNAHSIGGDRARGDVLIAHALEELDPAIEPRRYARLLARQARIQWAMNRGAEGLETAQRALALLDEDECDRDRASLLAWLSRTLVLRGKFRDAIEDGERALAAAVRSGDSYSEGEVLNTLGMAQMALGDVEQGTARLHQAIEIARGNDDIDGLAYAYANLSDLLLLRGHTRKSQEVAREGLALVPRRLGRGRDWLHLAMSEALLAAGDLEGARVHLVPAPHQAVGLMLIFRLLLGADLALADGDDQKAAEYLADVHPLVAQASEPQWIGPLGSMLGELHRRRGELVQARAAVASALDRLELCTDDVMRIARVTAAGARIEADFAQRGRDLRDQAMVNDALARARIHIARLRAAAQDGGPVEDAWRLTGVAELTRARGKSDPRAWTAAGAAWEALERPYQVAVARWRTAEAQVERGERGEAADSAVEALALARVLGAGRLVVEIEGLCDRARLGSRAAVPSAGADGNGGVGNGAAGTGPGPGSTAAERFGLTPREQQVLGLVAQGATNRQIGEALFMAEKTASVHVSRILAKLDVQSRTQAAAVAHRLGLSA